MTVYGNLEFLDLKYKPKKTDVVVEYYAEPRRGTSLKRLCEYLAGESSIGTWTHIHTMNPKIARTLKPHVFSINPETGQVKIAYPEDLFEAGNMPGILSSIAGNIFGMKEVKGLRFEDIIFTKKHVKAFRGPQYGVKGIRKMTSVKKRPFVGTIVKPKVGLTSAQHAKVAYDSWAGGLDLVKDDENLTSMTFNKFEKRMELTFKARDKAEKETGEKKLYLANITGPYNDMIKRAKMVLDNGGEYIMYDVLTAGWGALQGIRDFAQDHKLAIHGHRAMHGALTRNPHLGISMLVLAKTYRLIGIDTLHIGTAGIGKMHGSRKEELHVHHEVEWPYIKGSAHEKLLTQDWYGIKPTLAVASGGLSPLHLHKVMKVMGNDIVMQAGGGVHGHPNGTRQGATAMRQAVDAAMEGTPLKEYAKTHKELALALDKWG
ncbi:type III ribulose-bisphosphate carboxylase [Candidatus Woesearchaeota archaeon]|nr:type III ribulose-bisphosphate carboxylase [Candidatus Woesearchaeota archaeon]MBW3021477.1 type III ribulose-bisphosphate carboxylase [Candidatus Woesearchaeota archaeon]